jgi:hypothetical protein
MPNGVIPLLIFRFVHLGTILILVLGLYSGLCCRVRPVYLLSFAIV